MKTFRVLLFLTLLGVAVVGYIVLQILLPRGGVPVPAPGGRMIEGVVGTPSQYANPLLCQQNPADNDICQLVFAGLTQFEVDGSVRPHLASSWQVSADMTAYTFTLRADAVWSDGQPVVADDVLFTIDMLRDPRFTGRADVQRFWEAVEVQKVDDRTVQMRLAQPFAAFLDYTTIGLLPSHKFSDTVNAPSLNALIEGQKSLSSGPWSIASVSTFGDRITSVLLEPSQTYFGEKPKLGQLEFRYYPDSAALLQAFQRGDVDSAANLSPEDVEAAARLPRTVVHSMPQARQVSLLFNLRRDSGALPLTELAVRQALLYALDRPAIIRNALKGRGLLANTIFFPESWAFDAEVQLPGRDLDRARQLLQEAGYSLAVVAPANVEVWQKDNEPIGFTLLTSENPTLIAVAEEVARSWRELGIQVTVLPVPNIVRGFLASHQFQVALVETLLEGDPDPYSFWHGSQSIAGQNFTGWDNKDANMLLEQARQTLDRNARFEYYRRLQQIIREDLPCIPLYYPTHQYVLSSRVRNVQVGPIVHLSDRLRTLSQWTVNTRLVSPEEATAQATEGADTAR